MQPLKWLRGEGIPVAETTAEQPALLVQICAPDHSRGPDRDLAAVVASVDAEFTEDVVFDTGCEVKQDQEGDDEGHDL